MIFKRIWNDICKFFWAILGIVLIYILMHMFFDAFCPSVIVAGLPCPGCGMTRSIIFLFQGQVARSIYVHPMGIVVVMTALYAAFFRYILGKKIPLIKWIVLGLFLVAVVLYVTRMYLYFPHRPPYTYNPGNLFEKIIPQYRKLWQ